MSMVTKQDYIEYDIRNKERLIKEIDDRVVLELKKKKKYLLEIKEDKKKLNEMVRNG